VARRLVLETFARGVQRQERPIPAPPCLTLIATYQHALTPVPASLRERSNGWNRFLDRFNFCPTTLRRAGGSFAKDNSSRFPNTPTCFPSLAPCTAGMEKPPSRCPTSREKSPITICITASRWKGYFLPETRKKQGRRRATAEWLGVTGRSSRY